MPATQIDVQIPEAFSDLFKPARYKAFFGGRGSAKSHSFAKALLLEGGQTRLRILCAREIQRSIKDSVVDRDGGPWWWAVMVDRGGGP